MYTGGATGTLRSGSLRGVRPRFSFIARTLRTGLDCRCPNFRSVDRDAPSEGPGTGFAIQHLYVCGEHMRTYKSSVFRTVRLFPARRTTRTNVRYRTKYLNAFRKGDAGEFGALGEFIARAILDNLYKFIVPAVAGSALRMINNRSRSEVARAQRVRYSERDLARVRGTER